MDAKGLAKYVSEFDFNAHRWEDTPDNPAGRGGALALSSGCLQVHGGWFGLRYRFLHRSDALEILTHARGTCWSSDGTLVDRYWALVEHCRTHDRLFPCLVRVGEEHDLCLVRTALPVTEGMGSKAVPCALAVSRRVEPHHKIRTANSVSPSDRSDRYRGCSSTIRQELEELRMGVAKRKVDGSWDLLVRQIESIQRHKHTVAQSSGDCVDESPALHRQGTACAFDASTSGDAPTSSDASTSSDAPTSIAVSPPFVRPEESVEISVWPIQHWHSTTLSDNDDLAQESFTHHFPDTPGLFEVDDSDDIAGERPGTGLPAQEPLDAASLRRDASECILPASSESLCECVLVCND